MPGHLDARKQLTESKPFKSIGFVRVLLSLHLPSNPANNCCTEKLESSSRGSPVSHPMEPGILEGEAFRQSNIAPPHRKMPTRTSSRLDNAETLESTTLPPPPFAAKELPSVVHRSPDTCSRASTNLRKYVMADASCGIRKPRKSRGRGLRATTGWSVICNPPDSIRILYGRVACMSLTELA